MVFKLYSDIYQYRRYILHPHQQAFPIMSIWKNITKPKAAFTPQTKVDKLVLVNSIWSLWTAEKVRKHVGTWNSWRQIELASILINFSMLVNSYLTCERLANWTRVGNCQPIKTRVLFTFLLCLTLHKMGDANQYFQIYPAVMDVSST